MTSALQAEIDLDRTKFELVKITFNDTLKFLKSFAEAVNDAAGKPVVECLTFPDKWAQQGQDYILVVNRADKGPNKVPAKNLSGNRYDLPVAEINLNDASAQNVARVYRLDIGLAEKSGWLKKTFSGIVEYAPTMAVNNKVVHINAAGDTGYIASGAHLTLDSEAASHNQRLDEIVTEIYRSQPPATRQQIKFSWP